MITIKGHLQVRFLPLGSFRLKKSSFVAKFGIWWGQMGVKCLFEIYCPQTAHPWMMTHPLSHHALKSVEGSDLQI